MDKIKNIFTQGPISPAFIADSIARHASKTGIGAHSIFLGQVRADIQGGQRVAGIEYTAYEPMALERMHEIREDIFTRYDLTCMHVHHSLGLVKTGEVSLFVFTSAPHRRAAIDACNEVVESIKASLPVWGKEIFDNQDTRWKENR
ncbi:MAG TPA: molybdenum cofactor biosynthesis protein MoaE [Dinghuibacter sp.]|jgi:molybdopterin synthase catalytic subunit|uniref:molybdenum cofactor biosynthesis protein MoaE n=1 Tax=Dinghuibacter sp. TaxID=2024697 RepID=UPI002C2DD3BD|nr:molybdenum cofactor biosynthesis protein MoaE [Dinghuibacter sp.]HTJ10603.1 molybdenum cofactor biosynthesis protein MoaE [Dinghuibacter sp.]